MRGISTNQPHIPSIMNLITTTKHWSDEAKSDLQDIKTIKRCHSFYERRSKGSQIFSLTTRLMEIVQRNTQVMTNPKFEVSKIQHHFQSDPLSQIDFGFLSNFAKGWKSVKEKHVVNCNSFALNVVKMDDLNSCYNCISQVNSIQCARLREILTHFDLNCKIPAINIKRATLLNHVRYATIPLSIGIHEMCTRKISNKVWSTMSKEYLLNYLAKHSFISEVELFYKLSNVIQDFIQSELLYRLLSVILMLENTPDAQGAYRQFHRLLYLSLLQLKYPDPNEAISLFFGVFNQLCSITEEKPLQTLQSLQKSQKSWRAAIPLPLAL